ncbi:NUDIX domain-containing protein [Thiobacter aerophilum]|uniref:NUDIX domain-containing protein n=1 Tax=Thiobacter aerophilum TaxID=3121275 RepID=A0ABV0ECM5_9BURK
MPVKVDTAAILEEFAQGLPRLAGGRVDYSSARRLPVLLCFVECAGRILLLKRSAKVRSYPGKWGTVAGFIDRALSLEALACAELKAELGVPPECVAHFALGEPYEYTDPSGERTWRLFPMLARLAGTPRIEIDWEHTDFEWIEPQNLADYDTVPMLEESLRRAIRASIA